MLCHVRCECNGRSQAVSSKVRFGSGDILSSGGETLGTLCESWLDGREQQYEVWIPDGSRAESSEWRAEGI